MTILYGLGIGAVIGFIFGMVIMAAFRRPKPAPGRHRPIELSFDDLLTHPHQWE